VLLHPPNNEDRQDPLPSEAVFEHSRAVLYGFPDLRNPQNRTRVHVHYGVAATECRGLAAAASGRRQPHFWGGEGYPALRH